MINVEEENAAIHKKLAELYDRQRQVEERHAWLLDQFKQAFPSTLPPWEGKDVSPTSVPKNAISSSWPTQR